MLFLAQIVTSVISLYSFLCVVRILLTWIPSISYSPIGRFLASICDPYLNVFSRWNWTHFAGIDFSPIVALGFLSIIQYTFQGILTSGTVRLSIVLSILLSTIWSLISTITILLILLLIIRLVVLLTHNDNNQIWYRFDSAASQPLYAIPRLFTGGRPISYKAAIIIGIITSIVFYFACERVMGMLSNIISRIPF